jgi:hypothetical protein
VLFRSLRVYADDVPGTKKGLYAAIIHANAPGSLTPTDGIYDSGLAAHPGAKIGLAVLSEAGSSYIFIRPTRVGDLNLDGLVSIADFIDLAAHFNQGGTWQEGDLNYDGQVTIADFIDLASNFNQNYAGQSSPISPNDQQILSSFAASIGAASVPEPSMALLSLIGIAYSARRRK